MSQDIGTVLFSLGFHDYSFENNHLIILNFFIFVKRRPIVNHHFNSFIIIIELKFVLIKIY